MTEEGWEYIRRSLIRAAPSKRLYIIRLFADSFPS